MNQFNRELSKILVGLFIFGAAIFIIGFFVGRSNPTIKTILMDDKPDREFIERYHVAGGGYQYVLHKEYVLDAEFLVDGDD